MTNIPETGYATRVANLLSDATDHWRKSDFPTAEKICREALALASEHLGKDSVAYGYCLEDLGIFLTAQHNLHDARDVLGEALSVMEKALGSRAAEVERIFGRLHDLYH
jgi:Tetratricopeptide repeat